MRLGRIRGEYDRIFPQNFCRPVSSICISLHRIVQEDVSLFNRPEPLFQVGQISPFLEQFSNHPVSTVDSEKL